MAKQKQVAKVIDESQYEDQLTQTKKDIIGNNLTAIAEQHGQLTPEIILEQASDPEHELHQFFIWDDTEAARRYRLNQARGMILSVKFVVELVVDRKRDKVAQAIEKATSSPVKRPTARVRQFLSMPKQRGAFAERSTVLDEVESRRIMVDKKISVLRSWCDSIVDIEELSTIRTGVLELIG